MQERSHHSKLKKIPVGAGASNTELDRVQVLHLTTEVAQERHLSSSPKEVPVVLSGLHTAHLRRYQGKPVGETAKLDHGQVLARASRLTPDSRGGQGKLAADSFVIAVCRPMDRKPDQPRTERHALVLRTWPPVGEEGEEVGDADVAVAVEVGGPPGSRRFGSATATTK